MKVYQPEITKALEKARSWVHVLPSDPCGYLLDSGESFTVYRTLVDLLDFPMQSDIVKEAHDEVLADPSVERYIAGLSDWKTHVTTSHAKEDNLPNQLWLLLQWGITSGVNTQGIRAVESIDGTTLKGSKGAPAPREKAPARRTPTSSTRSPSK